VLALTTLHERVVDFEARLESKRQELDDREPATCRVSQETIEQLLRTTATDAAPETVRVEPPKSDVMLSAKGRRRMTMFLAAVTTEAALEASALAPCHHADNRLFRIDTPFRGLHAVQSGTDG
jgi:hypothetical protein